jgi:hypothetical protein
MRGCLLLTGVALSLAALALPTTAVACWYEIRFLDKDKAPPERVGGAFLGVIDGKVWAIRSPGGDLWELSTFKTKIEFVDPEEELKRWYLAYDPEGKDKALFLVPRRKRGPGQKWEITDVREAQGPSYTIRAAEGKVKGWYLDVAEQPEQVKDAKGRRYTAYRVFLSEKPKRIPKVSIEVIGK